MIMQAYQSYIPFYHRCLWWINLFMPSRLCHLNSLDRSFSNIRVSSYCFLLLCFIEIPELYANSVDPATFYLGLHCLPMSRFDGLLCINGLMYLPLSFWQICPSKQSRTRFNSFSRAVWSISTLFIIQPVPGTPLTNHQSSLNLTHLSLASHKMDTGKQCRPKSVKAGCDIWSGSTLFAFRTK